MPEKNNGAVPLGENSTILGQLSDRHQPDIYRGMNNPRSGSYPPFVRGNLVEVGPPRTIRRFDPERLEESSLDLAIKAYKEHPTKPDIVRGVVELVWNEWGKEPGVTFKSDKLNITEEQTSLLHRAGLAPFYMPEKIAGPEGIEIMDKMFPDLDMDQALRLAAINNKDLVTEPGWWSVETNPNSPNLSRSETAVRRVFKEQKRQFLDLSTYIAYSQFNRLVYGDRLDQGSFSMVKAGDKIIFAGFDPDPVGRLHIYDAFGIGSSKSSHAHPLIGARSKGRV